MSGRQYLRKRGASDRKSSARPGRRVSFEPLEGRRLFCDQSHFVDMTFWGLTGSNMPGPSSDGPGIAAVAEAPAVAESLVSPAADPVTAAGLPILNSVPGAPTSVYLDFDGYTSSTQSNAPYDTDGSPSTFNASEQGDIREAWRHVASYFSMFNTNVTTIKPSNAYSYSLITNDLQGAGYSYLQFNTGTPSAYNGSGDARTRQSGLAHEIGHNFSLAHQSDYDLLGEKTHEYSSGYDNLHGPVMGVDYAQSIHKWFIGHPSDSPTRVQDDVQVIADKIKPFTNGGDGMRPDDVPNAVASARVLGAVGGVFSASGVIERLTDADAYSFTSAGAQMRLDVTLPAPSMLDAKLEVYDSGGSLFAGSDAATNDQHLTLSLPAGTYYALVRSHGDYGDLGPYDLNIRTTGTLPVPPTYNSLAAPQNVVLGPGAGTTLSVAWGAVDGATGYSIERSADGATWASAGTTPAANVTTFDDPSSLNGGRRYFYRVSALDGTGRSAPSAVAYTTTRPNNVSTLTFTSWKPDQIILNWRDVSGDSGYRVERQTDATADTWVTAGTVGANVPSYTATGLTQGTTYRFRVTALGPFGDAAPVQTSGVTRLPAVSGLAYTARQSNRMAIRWNALSSAATYRVQRSVNGIDWDTLATQTGTTYEDNTVQPVREYYYRVVALNGSSQGLLGTTVFAATPAAAPQALPAGWADRDIGQVGGSGATGYAAGTYTVLTSGNDIWDSADQFHYTYQPLVGDGEIVARVASQEPTSGWAKAGVMIRENLTPGSRHAMMVITPDNGGAFQYRATAGGVSTNVNTAGAFAPYWVRLVRQGNTLIGYRSAGGTGWVEQGRTTIAMGQNTFIGLAVVSGDNSRLENVTFTNVTLANRAPTIASAAAANPAPVSGTTTTLSVLGADDHGETNLRYTWSADQVPQGASAPTFSDSNTNAARSVTATFSGAGTYVLRVTATDTAGLSTFSTVTVQVVPTAAALAVTPAAPRVGVGQSLQMSASLVDQFGAPVLPAPAVTWYASDGQIDDAGRYTAPAAPGQYMVAADGGGFFQVVNVEVVDGDFLAPTLVSAASSKSHGRRGAFDLPLSLGGNATVEPRQGGATTLKLAFGEPLAAIDGALDAGEFAVTNAAFSSVSFDTAGGLFVLTLNLVGVADGGLVTVALGGLSDLAGNPLAGDRDVSVRSLFGDVDGSGAVNNLDVVEVRSGLASGGAWNYLLDLDLSGSVNSRDVLLARTRTARGLAGGL
jgi:hypothetical protein